MHRSGTSAITRALRLLGVGLGDRLMPPVPGNNQKGFWEDRDLSAVNDKVLAELGASWHAVGLIRPEDLAGPKVAAARRDASALLAERLDRMPVFGFKDPRTCRLLPFWQPIFAQLSVQERYVIAARNPLSVALSLAKRDGFDARKSFLLWLGHVLQSLVQTEGTRRIVVAYDALLDEPRRQLERMAAALGLPLAPEPSADWAEFDDFLTRDLRHSRFDAAALAQEPMLPALARDVYASLQRLASGEQDPNDPASVQEWRGLEQAFGSLAPALDLIDAHDQARRDAAVRLQASEQSIAEQNANAAAIAQANEMERASLRAVLEEKDAEAHALRERIARQEAQLAEWHRAVIRANEARESLNQAIRARDERLVATQASLAEREGRLRALEGTVAELRAAAAEAEALKKSHSWRITAPLREAKRLIAPLPPRRSRKP